MQVTPDELLAEAGQMALQLRLQERDIERKAAEIDRLTAENAELKTQLKTQAEDA
jgi:cell division protein FtsB